MKSVSSNTGSLISGAIASVCCIGPLLITALGVSGVSWIPGLARFRPYFIIIAFGFLFWSWYVLLKKKSSCEAGSPAAKSLKRSKVSLAVVTLLVLLLLALPYFLSGKMKARVKASKAAKVTESSLKYGEKVVTVTEKLQIEGMTCVACPPKVKAALSKIDGVKDAKVSLKDKQAIVTYDPEKVTTAQMIDAVSRAGYKASLPR